MILITCNYLAMTMGFLNFTAPSAVSVSLFVWGFWFLFLFFLQAVSEIQN